MFGVDTHSSQQYIAGYSTNYRDNHYLVLGGQGRWRGRERKLLFSSIIVSTHSKISEDALRYLEITGSLLEVISDIPSRYIQGAAYVLVRLA